MKKKRISAVLAAIMAVCAIMPAYASADGTAFADPNGDSKTDSQDATLILSEYSALSTGGTSSLTEEEKQVADVNSDGKLDSRDASDVLEYYSYQSTGGWRDAEVYFGVKETPKFEVSDKTDPDFNPNEYDWGIPKGVEYLPFYINYDPDYGQANWVTKNDIVYFGNLFEAYGWYHDDSHVWSSECIGFTNSNGDEVFIYPDLYTTIKKDGVTTIYNFNDEKNKCLSSTWLSALPTYKIDREPIDEENPPFENFKIEDVTVSNGVDYVKMNNIQLYETIFQLSLDYYTAHKSTYIEE